MIVSPYFIPGEIGHGGDARLGRDKGVVMSSC